MSSREHRTQCLPSSVTIDLEHLVSRRAFESVRRREAFANGDMQRLPTTAIEEETAAAGSSPANSASTSHDGNPETSVNGSKKRKRSLTISYVI